MMFGAHDDTRPTACQVETLIEQAIFDVQTILGTSPPDYLWGGAQSAATLKPAMYVELSYYPDQVRSDRSAYQYYAEMYVSQVRALQAAAGGLAPGGNRVFPAAIPFRASIRYRCRWAWQTRQTPRRFRSSSEPPSATRTMWSALTDGRRRQIRQRGSRLSTRAVSRSRSRWSTSA
jgi:hypothetical protein